MPLSLLVTSLSPLAGKTTIAAGLTRRLRVEGKAATLSRTGDDEHAAADADTFTAIREPQSSEHAIREAPAGPGRAAEGERVIVVASAADASSDIAEYSRSFASSLAGVIVNKVPGRRSESIRAALEGQGLVLLASVPEDRVLAAPTLGTVLTALDGRASFLNGNTSLVVDKPVIASISADPGQAYFARYDAGTVIVRSDKPDLQLAALNAGARCLIITGDHPLLSYVLSRAEEEQIPLIQTRLDTSATLGGIEGLFNSSPFAASEPKLARIAELLSEVDPAKLAS